MTSIRLYGEFGGESSIPRVTKGFAQVFPDAAQFHLSSWGNDLDEGEPDQPGATADVGIFVGGLAGLKYALRAKHKKLYVMVAPNSSTIGPLLSDVLRLADVIMVPSSWARGVLEDTLPGKRVICVSHGVDPRFQPSGGKPRGEFSVAHLSSTVLERKGTDKLLEGWALADIPGGELYLSVPGGRRLFFEEEVERLGIEGSVKVTDRLNYHPDMMSTVYSSMHFICQPSRGEGFGMVPLEARCCGTPVIATNCTGHSAHVWGPGVLAVPTGLDAPIDDFPGAVAPSLFAEDVATALTYAYEHRERFWYDAQKHASALREHWSWENQLKELKNELSGKLSE